MLIAGLSTQIAPELAAHRVLHHARQGPLGALALERGQDVASGPCGLLRAQGWGREQWERLAEGQVFDGMESWLPWLTEQEDVLFDLLDESSLVLLVEPRRMRDRAADILAEEDDLASKGVEDRRGRIWPKRSPSK